MASPITSLPVRTTALPSSGSAGSASSAPSTTTAKVANYFHQYNHGLCENFGLLDNPLYRDHFKNSRKAIITAAEGLSGTALLLGVGGALDLPLTELAKQFDAIDLVDMDTRILAEVVACMPEDIRAKFRTHSIDLTGIFAQLDKLLDSLVKSKTSHIEFCDKAAMALETLKRTSLPYPVRSASFVVSSLVSSQLSHLLNEYLDERSRLSYGKPFIRKSNDEMLKFADATSKFEEAHMQDLLTLVTPEGKIYFADHFSLQNAESIVIAGDRVLKTTKETLPLYNGVKVQEFAKMHFKNLREEKWDWVHPVHTRNTILIQFADGRVTLASKESYKIFNITSLTLSPK